MWIAIHWCIDATRPDTVTHTSCAVALADPAGAICGEASASCTMFESFLWLYAVFKRATLVKLLQKCVCTSTLPLVFSGKQWRAAVTFLP